MKSLVELEFWLIGYGLSLKKVKKIIEYIKKNKE